MSSNPARRIVSVDQFRGYTVAGMFLVNFLGELAVTHQVLKHNNTHFSYADSIMPSFFFICGFSFRYTFLRRIGELGWSRCAGRIVKRSLALILVSVMVYGFNELISTWKGVSPKSAGEFLAVLLKANLWEVLALIGAVQLLLLPVVAATARVRVAALVLFGVLHILLSWSFNYDFVYGRPNWMDPLWGTVEKRAWDGGFFGLISWAEVMLAGTLAHDVVVSRSPQAACRRLFAWGAALMISAYALSCLATLYGPSDGSPKDKMAVSPVVPPFANVRARSWASLLAAPPFLPPPPPDVQPSNYWMMDKRVVTQPFVLFSTGFAAALFGLFVVACDAWGWQLGLFRTFGQNPLAAYIIHHFVAHSILGVVPRDSPLWWALTGLAVFFGITWIFVRSLEKHGLYLRL